MMRSLALPLTTLLVSSGFVFPETFQVTHSGDSGDNSLRAAIAAVNAATGADTITFNLPPGDAGHRYYRDDGVLG